MLSIFQKYRFTLCCLAWLSITTPLLCYNNSNAEILNLFGIKKKNAINEEAESPVEDYYRAMHLYATGEYKKSLDAFGEIERKYPTFSYLSQTRLMQIYLNYLSRHYEEVANLTESFIGNHPNTPYMAYLKFMVATCTSHKITGVSKTYEMAVKAKAEMEHVAEKYPDTVYGQSAIKRVIYLSDFIVYDRIIASEVYFGEGNYAPAIITYQKALRMQEKLGINTFTPILQYRLYECFMQLGMFDIAEKYLTDFNRIMENFNGNVSFVIEGVVEYKNQEDRQKIEESKIATSKRNKAFLRSFHHPEALKRQKSLEEESQRKKRALTIPTSLKVQVPKASATKKD